MTTNDYKQFRQAIDDMDDIVHTEKLDCPNCHKPDLHLNDTELDENYDIDRFTRSETFVCYSCNTRIEVTDVYHRDRHRLVNITD